MKPKQSRFVCGWGAAICTYDLPHKYRANPIIPPKDIKIVTCSGFGFIFANCELFWFPAWLFLLAFLSTGSHLGLGPEMPM